jgi:hypothetical protein
MISISINQTENTEISENERFVTKCGHNFHQLCINRWFCNILYVEKKFHYYHDYN